MYGFRAIERSLEAYHAVANPLGIRPARTYKQQPVKPASAYARFVAYAAAVSPFDDTFAEEGLRLEDDVGFVTTHVGPPD